MKRHHYHVCENTPGYLPDSDPAVFRSRRDAVAYAASLAAELRDDGYWVTGRDGDYYAERSAEDLGRVIKMTVCYDPACPAED